MGCRRDRVTAERVCDGIRGGPTGGHTTSHDASAPRMRALRRVDASVLLVHPESMCSRRAAAAVRSASHRCGPTSSAYPTSVCFEVLSTKHSSCSSRPCECRVTGDDDFDCQHGALGRGLRFRGLDELRAHRGFSAAVRKAARAGVLALTRAPRCARRLCSSERDARRF